MSTPAGADYFEAYTALEPLEEQGLAIADELERAARKIGAKLAGARVLDLGCGQGQVVAALRERGCEAFGVELSPWALAHPVPHAAPFLFLMDATDLRIFPERSFDLLIANLTPHIEPERMVEFLRGCARIASLGVHVRYITQEWAETFVEDLGPEKGPAARAMYAPWTRDHAWWRQVFLDAGLRELCRETDEVWDTWVLVAAA